MRTIVSTLSLCLVVAGAFPRTGLAQRPVTPTEVEEWRAYVGRQGGRQADEEPPRAHRMRVRAGGGVAFGFGAGADGLLLALLDLRLGVQVNDWTAVFVELRGGPYEVFEICVFHPCEDRSGAWLTTSAMLEGTIGNLLQLRIGPTVAWQSESPNGGPAGGVGASGAIAFTFGGFSPGDRLGSRWPSRLR